MTHLRDNGHDKTYCGIDVNAETWTKLCYDIQGSDCKPCLRRYIDIQNTIREAAGWNQLRAAKQLNELKEDSNG